MLAMGNNFENIVMDTTNRLGALSIVVDDFDSSPKRSSCKQKRQESEDDEIVRLNSGAKPYTRQTSDAAIKKIMEEVELRKTEFCKLIDEHDALVKNLKKIEKEHSSTSFCKMNQSPITTTT